MNVGHWTSWLYSIEGEFTKGIQDLFYNDTLTSILNFISIYLLIFNLCNYSILRLQRR